MPASLQAITEGPEKVKSRRSMLSAKVDRLETKLAEVGDLLKLALAESKDSSRSSYAERRAIRQKALTAQILQKHGALGLLSEVAADDAAPDHISERAEMGHQALAEHSTSPAPEHNASSSAEIDEIVTRAESPVVSRVAARSSSQSSGMSDNITLAPVPPSIKRMDPTVAATPRQNGSSEAASTPAEEHARTSSGAKRRRRRWRNSLNKTMHKRESLYTPEAHGERSRFGRKLRSPREWWKVGG